MLHSLVLRLLLILAASALLRMFVLMVHHLWLIHLHLRIGIKEHAIVVEFWIFVYWIIIRPILILNKLTQACWLHSIYVLLRLKEWHWFISLRKKFGHICISYNAWFIKIVRKCTQNIWHIEAESLPINVVLVHVVYVRSGEVWIKLSSAQLAKEDGVIKPLLHRSHLGLQQGLLLEVGLVQLCLLLANQVRQVHLLLVIVNMHLFSILNITLCQILLFCGCEYWFIQIVSWKSTWYLRVIWIRTGNARSNIKLIRINLRFLAEIQLRVARRTLILVGHGFIPRCILDPWCRRVHHLRADR